MNNQILERRSYPGYENVGETETEIAYPSNVEPILNEKKELLSLPVISEEEGKEAFLNKFSRKCCAKDLSRIRLTSYEPSVEYRYILETFIEKRSAVWVSEPSNEPPSLHSISNNVPSPWSIVITPTRMFVEDTVNKYVPNTSFIQRCKVCENGIIKCENCNGVGMLKCEHCEYEILNYKMRNPNHHSMHQSLIRKQPDFRNPFCDCDSNGFKECSNCRGKKFIKCGKCQGKRYLKRSIKLIVRFQIQAKDYFNMPTIISEKKIRFSDPKTTFEEEAKQVTGISKESLNLNHDLIHKINCIIRSQSNSLNFKARILKQRHCIRATPVAQFRYNYDSDSYEFIVYGVDKKVVAKSYPGSCCVIL